MTKGFDNLEFEMRVKRARELMEKNNIDILLLTTPHNFRYFSGLDSYFWESPTRPWFLLIPQNSDPIALVPSIGQTALEKTWLTNIKTWSSPNPKDEGITLLKETIASTESPVNSLHISNIFSLNVKGTNAGKVSIIL